jgi:urease subunit beta
MSEPGGIIPMNGKLTINEGREKKVLEVQNTSDQTIFVTSHYHFFEANKNLLFDRRTAYGMRLDVPAGTGVKWAPGETRQIELVEYAGRREVFGFNGFVNGKLDTEDPNGSLDRLKKAGFLNLEEHDGI